MKQRTHSLINAAQTKSVTQQKTVSEATHKFAGMGMDVARLLRDANLDGSAQAKELAAKLAAVRVAGSKLHTKLNDLHSALHELELATHRIR